MDTINIEAIGIDTKTDMLTKVVTVFCLVLSGLILIGLTGSLRFTGDTRKIAMIIGALPGVLSIILLSFEFKKKYNRKKLISDRAEAVKTGEVFDGTVTKAISVVDKYRRARVIAEVTYGNNSTVETLKMREKSVFKWGVLIDTDDTEGEIYETSNPEDNILIGRKCKVYVGTDAVVVDIDTGDGSVRV